jgi:hypothetical protein
MQKYKCLWCQKILDLKDFAEASHHLVKRGCACKCLECRDAHYARKAKRRAKENLV